VETIESLGSKGGVLRRKKREKGSSGMFSESECIKKKLRTAETAGQGDAAATITQKGKNKTKCKGEGGTKGTLLCEEAVRLGSLGGIGASARSGG